MTQDPKRSDRTNSGSAPAAAAEEQLLLYQQGFGHYNTYSARAHEFCNGGQQVDGEYEQVNHRMGGSTMSASHKTCPRRSVFARIYEFAMDRRKMLRFIDVNGLLLFHIPECSIV